MTDDRECRMYLREFVMYRLTARPSDEPWEDTISAFLAARQPPFLPTPLPDNCPKCGKRWSGVYQRDADTIMCLCNGCGVSHLASIAASQPPTALPVDPVADGAASGLPPWKP